jgi:hypothetical protein
MHHAGACERVARSSPRGLSQVSWSERFSGFDKPSPLSIASLGGGAPPPSNHPPTCTLHQTLAQSTRPQDGPQGLFPTDTQTRAQLALIIKSLCVQTQKFAARNRILCAPRPHDNAFWRPISFFFPLIPAHGAGAGCKDGRQRNQECACGHPAAQDQRGAARPRLDRPTQGGARLTHSGQ